MKKKSGKEAKENNKLNLGDSERETMSEENLGVCDGWLSCVMKGDIEGTSVEEDGGNWVHFPGEQVLQSLDPD